MNKQIICETCYIDVRNRYPTDSPYPGEHIKLVHGLALNDYICDLCGAILPVGCDCTAYTIWTNDYAPWEECYIFKLEIETEP
jgi:hypothetical protein